MFSKLDLKTRILSLVVILSNVLGNFALTFGMRQQEVALTPLGLLRTIFTPWVLVGITLLILWLLSRMTLLSWADLSFVLPVTSLGYVLSAMIGKIFFAEQISPQRWAGTFLIVAGIVLVGRTAPRTAQH